MAMKISISTRPRKTTGALLVFVYAGNLREQIAAFPVSAQIKRLLRFSEALIKTGPAATFVTSAQNGKMPLIVVGLGKKKDVTNHVLARAVRAGCRIVEELQVARLSIGEPQSSLSQEDFVRLVSIQSELALYRFGKYKKPQKRTLVSIDISLLTKPKDVQALRRVSQDGVRIAEEINNARNLSNTPGGDMTPRLLAEHAVRDGKRAGFSVRVYNRKKLESLKMGGILGVARGSSEEPQLIVCEYTSKQAVNEKPLVFVGKGVTFDTGGLNLKPEEGMLDMHLDMSGGASVLHAVAAIARLQLPVHVVALIPAVENMPGSSGYRPGDILRAYNGKTIEVRNTDAEGRLILADALSYAKEFSPELIIDLATLTGSAMAALGQRAAALMTTDAALEKQLLDAGEASSDRVWPFPLWPEFSEDIKGDFGDVMNLGRTKYGGTIIGGAFLKEFAPIQKWAHIDIAPTMTSIPEDQLAKGSKGTGVHLLVAFTEQYVETHAKKK